jgi:hypothetical protein
MKRVNKKLVVPVVVILMLLAGVITVILLNPGTTVISLKSGYANFVEKDEIVTEVRFLAPANFNAIKLDSESKTSRDEHGNDHQTITYNGSVKKALFASMPTVTINRSCTYVFVFSDKTVTIVDGKVTDSLHK